MPQKDLTQPEEHHRTTEEQQRFRAALATMLHLYASPRVVVLQHKNVPINSLFSDRLNRRPYEQRGWCIVEQYTALSVNVCEKVADIARGYYVPASGNRIEPEQLAALIARAHFTGTGDRELVLVLYEALYATAQDLDHALLDAGLGVVQAKPGKKSKPGESGAQQMFKELKDALHGKIRELV